MTIEKNQYGNYRVVIDYTEDNAVVIELSQAQRQEGHQFFCQFQHCGHL